MPNKIEDLLNQMIELTEDNELAENSFIVLLGTNGKDLAWAGLNSVKAGQQIQSDIVGIGEIVNFIMACRGPERSIAYSRQLDVKKITDDAMVAIFDAVNKVQTAEAILSTLVVEEVKPELKIVK